MNKTRRGRLWYAVVAATLLTSVVVVSAQAQEGEPELPRIGMISIDALDSNTGLRPSDNAHAVDFRIAWEYCPPEQEDRDRQWLVDTYQAYFWNTPTLVGEPDLAGDLPPLGADSSGPIEDPEFTFQKKQTDQQSYFMVRGILKSADQRDSLVVFSPVSMDIFPRPVFAVTLWQKLCDWIADVPITTPLIIGINVIVWILGMCWGWGCIKRQRSALLFPAKDVQAQDILTQALSGRPGVSDADRERMQGAISRALGMIDEFRPSRSGLELKNLPAYRVIDGAVHAFLSVGVTPADIQSTLEHRVGIELMDLRTRSRAEWVWNAGYIEPLVGLFGTVTGLALAFSAKVADRDSDMYAGIYEALFTTIAGLAAGIILIGVYYYCDHRFHRVEGAFQRLAAELATHLRR